MGGGTGSLWGGNSRGTNGKITIQKGDEILVGVTPDNLHAEWVYESSGKPVFPLPGEGTAFCTVAQGAPQMDSLVFRRNYFDCARLPHKSGGEDMPLGFSITHDYKAIKDGEGGASPDARAKVTVFEVNVAAWQVLDSAGASKQEHPTEPGTATHPPSETGLLLDHTRVALERLTETGRIGPARCWRPHPQRAPPGFVCVMCLTKLCPSHSLVGAQH